MKIGMYNDGEILEHLTEGEGRGFLGRSMYDAIIDYITNLQEKLNRIDKLINTDYGWVSYYYKYNNMYLKSEIKEDINNILKGE